MRRQAAGFTMIELLIAMMLLSSVIFIASMSFSVFSSKWQQKTGRFDLAASEVRNLLAVQKSIRAMASYLVFNEQQKPVYFFVGEPEQLTFITSKPVFTHAAQAIVMLKVETEPDSEQQLLVYYEAPLERVFRSTGQQPDFQFREVIARQRNIRFNYFGWVNLQQRAEFYDGASYRPEWQTTYDGSRNGMLPYGINLSWDENEPVIFPVANDNYSLMMYTDEIRSGG